MGCIRSCFNSKRRDSTFAELMEENSSHEDVATLITNVNPKTSRDTKEDIDNYFSKGLQIGTFSGVAISEQRAAKVMRGTT